MNNSNDDSFRRRREGESGDGIKYTGTDRPVIGIKIDDRFDLPALHLDSFASPELGKKAIAEKMKDVPSSNLRIDAASGNLAQLENSIKDIHKQQQNSRIRAYLEEAQRYMNSGQYSKALAPLDKALDIDATSITTLLLKGYCFFSLKQYEQAIGVLREAHSHMGPQNGEILFMILILEAACMGAIYQAIKKKIEAFLAREQYTEALAFINVELRKRPSDPILLYNRCGIFILMEKFSDARKAAREAMVKVGAGDITQFQELLTIIDQQEAEQRLEAVRGMIRRGDLSRAIRELENCRAALGGQEHYETIYAYVEARRNPHQEKKSGGLFSMFGGGKSRQKDNLQQVLLWLLADELAAGMAAIEQQNFTDAINAFITADQIDSRCGAVAYLHGFTIYRAFEQMVEQSNGPENIDLVRASQMLNRAAHALQRAVSDPLLAKQARNLLEAVHHYGAEISVAQCVQNFKEMMNYYEQYPVRDYAAVGEARRQVSAQLSAVAATRVKQSRGSQNLQVLNQLEKALRTIERQLK